MKNISQATYDRIHKTLRCNAHWKSIHRQDAHDLLEAYEGALRLLDHLLESCVDCDGSLHVAQAEEFLYLESGEPHVKLSLDEDEERSYSARGLLRPASVDSEDY